MGMVYAVMEIGDLAGERFAPFRGMVDTGSSYTTLPARLLRSVGLEPTGTESFELADGRSVLQGCTIALLRYHGVSVRVPVSFDDTNTQILIGSTALEALRLAVDPANGRLAPSSWLRMPRSSD